MPDAGYQIIRGGRLLDGEAHRGDFADILIKGDIIREIGSPGIDAPEGALEVDASDRLILPGLVNAHTHGDATFAKGLGDRWTLELLLNAQPMRRDGVGLEDKYLAARLAAAEMVLNGCTACYDLFSEFPAPTPEGLDAVGRGYAGVGIRAVVAPLMADRSFWRAIPGLYGALPESLQGEIDRITAAPMEICLANCRAAARAWSLERDQVRLALAPTIPHHCADDFFRACRAMADEFGLGIHTHVAESKVQAVVGRKKYRKSLTAHLGDLGLIGPDFTAAHAVWVDDEDLRLLGHRGASIAHNPTSNLRLGVGLARVRAMLKHGLNVGIGTDTSTCSDLLNMFEAMRLACYVSRAQSPDPDAWLGAEQVLVMATQGSARVLGMDGAIGRLAAGYKADLVFVDLANLAYVPLNHPARQVVFQETGAGVESVMVGGRFIVRGRQLLTVDLSELRREAEAANERIAAANRSGAELVRRLAPIVGSFCVGLAKEPHHVHRYADH